jgi:hypothetical protein
MGIVVEGGKEGVTKTNGQVKDQGSRKLGRKKCPKKSEDCKR